MYTVYSIRTPLHLVVLCVTAALVPHSMHQLIVYKSLTHALVKHIPCTLLFRLDGFVSKNCVQYSSSLPNALGIS